MRFVSYLASHGPSYGVLRGEGVVDLSAALGATAPDLRSLIAAGLLPKVAELTAGRQPDVELGKVDLLPVIPNPGKIVCIGLNYYEHVTETGQKVTEDPTLFLRLPASQVAHGQAIVLPPETQKLDYEGEIAIVIGKAGRRIREADAWSYIAGYSCYNDGSVRDWQMASSQWTAGKNFWRTGGFGPWMVSGDEIGPGRSMTLCTRVNGQEVQRATTDMMIHSIPRQIAFVSTFIPLEPGDVIVTGTPGGVGARRNPPLFLKPGDVVEVEVDAIGILSNTVVAEQTQS
jgi:2-keto-4-pentenoate hydratase/2-oxohepta-3-ene-1,7-dioic acid hydratase in catechol pathway